MGFSFLKFRHTMIYHLWQHNELMYAIKNLLNKYYYYYSNLRYKYVTKIPQLRHPMFQI